MKTGNLLIILLLFCATRLPGQIIHVPGSQPTIQSGIDAATDGDTVLIADGVYFENISFNGKAITVASHYLVDGDTSHITGTVVDGSQSTTPDSASVVFFGSGEDTTSLLVGLTIRGGSGTLTDVYDGARMGGGILCLNSGAKIIRNRIIDNNISHETFSIGAGIGGFTTSPATWVVLSDNVIAGNTNQTTGDDSEWRSAAGGGVYLQANARVHRNDVYNNACMSSYAADGAGMEFESDYNGNPIFEVIMADNNIHYNSAQGGVQPFGGGLSVYYTNMDIRNNKINHNTLITESYGMGAGVNIFGWESFGDLIVFQGNEVIGNSFQGPGNTWGTAMNLSNIDHRIEIRNNIIEGNDGMASTLSYGTLCIFVYSDEWPQKNSEVIIDGNVFRDNSCKYGGAISVHNSFNFTFTNNLFQRNHADFGGALYLEQVQPPGRSAGREETISSLVNNTFIANEASFIGGAVYNIYTSQPVVSFNNIFWQNDAPDGPEVHTSSMPPLYIAFSDIDTNKITGPWAGSDNFYGDPLFETDSLHITGSSPCFNTGALSISYDGLTFSCPQHDIDGEDRPMSGNAEIGADELLFVGLSLKQQHEDLPLRIYPNPFSDQAILSFYVKNGSHCIIEVYNSSGNRVETIVSRHFENGYHQVSWNGTRLPSGIYCVRLLCGSDKQVAKIFHVR